MKSGEAHRLFGTDARRKRNRSVRVAMHVGKDCNNGKKTFSWCKDEIKGSDTHWFEEACPNLHFNLLVLLKLLWDMHEYNSNKHTKKVVLPSLVICVWAYLINDGLDSTAYLPCWKTSATVPSEAEFRA
eukprot:3474950-Pleurochrysis_carterae.AAC.1